MEFERKKVSRHKDGYLLVDEKFLALLYLLPTFINDEVSEGIKNRKVVAEMTLNATNKAHFLLGSVSQPMMDKLIEQIIRKANWKAPDENSL